MDNGDREERPFHSARHIIIHYRHKNPARMRNANVFDRQVYHGGSQEDLHEAHMLWFMTARVIGDSMKGLTAEAKDVVINCELGKEQTGERESPADYCKIIGRHKRTLYKWITVFREELERLAVKKELMYEPDEKRFKNSRENYDKDKEEKAEADRAERRRRGNK